MLMKKERVPKVSEVLNPLSAIFQRMDYDFEFIEKKYLDLLFVTSYGDRTIAPLFKYFVEYDFEKDKYLISDENLQEISNVVLSFYKINWDKIKEVVKTQYDPIHNFSDEVTEKISDVDKKELDGTNSTTDTGTLTKQRTDDLNSSETRNLSGSQTDDTTYQMQGFNSSSFQNKDKDNLSRQTTDTGTVSVSNTGTQENIESRDLSVTETTSSIEDFTHERDRTVSRIGNIGNITTQKMLHEEIELWKWNFIESILKDAKDMLTLAVYSS